MSFVNWEFYSSLHNKVKQADFAVAEELAENEIKSVVGPIKWASITEDTYGFTELKNCICNVMDRMAQADATGLGKGLTSVSNDGYSESFALNSESALKGEIRSSIRRDLSGTGIIGAY